MKVLLSWIRDFVDVPGTAEEIGLRMSMRGLPLEGIEALEPGPLPPGRTHNGSDATIDFEVTANRPDCLSMLGIAREIATVYDLPLRKPADLFGSSGLAEAHGGQAEAWPRTLVDIPVTIDDPDLCARYVAGLAEVKIAPSPAWIESRLMACGVRPINNVVDITNYVLLEMGHPMHAFDLARLNGPAIVVRRARPGEQMRTLDGKMRSLTAEMLVIADAERAQAIGGVMGGADSEVSDTTRQIVLESAWFKPQSVRATARGLGLRTEASYRFERGADLTAAADAMRRAIELIALTGAGRGSGRIVDCYPRPYEPRHLTVTRAAIDGLLGMHVPPDEATRILAALGFGVRELGSWQSAAPDAAAPVIQRGHGWTLEVPGWRHDVQRDVDLVEEVGRHHGFEHLPATFPAVAQAPPPSDPRIARDARVRRALVAMGFSEAITFAFVDDRAAAPYGANGSSVALANPLSEKFSTLRPSLLPGLVDAVSHNRRHGRRDVRLFEIGTRFSPRGESRGVGAAWTGLATPEHWSGAAREVDFFDIKGVAEQIASVMDVAVSYQPAARAYLVDGRAAELRIDGNALGVIGQLQPQIAEARDLPAGDALYVFELDLDLLTRHVPTAPKFARPLPRHPLVVRDVAILIDDTLSAETVRGTIRAVGPATLVDVREFDRYQGKGIPDGKTSLAVRLTFQAPDRTLTDAEVQAAMHSIVTALRDQLGAIQR